jgi:two-component system, cell cycle response regulator DivK
MGKRILVVEDTEDNRQIIRDLLTSFDYELLEAVDGAEGVAMAQSERPDLILMDIQLPGMDGWELTRRLKRNTATSHIPVIALTAYGTKGDEDRARDAGCIAFIAKPVSTRELPGIVRRYLS